VEIQIPDIDTKELTPAEAAAQQYMMRGLVEPEVFGKAVQTGERTVRRWMQEGLPVIYYGRKPFVVIESARDWLIARGRPSREATQ
jgi:hypothetical protein